MVELLSVSCTKEIKPEYDSVFNYLNQNNNIFEFGDFFAVERTESNSYFYKNNDFGAEYIFNLTSDSTSPFSYFDEVKIKSDNYIKKSYPEDFMKIDSLINENLLFCATLFQKYKLKAINGWVNNNGNAELEFSFKDNKSLYYLKEASNQVLGNKKILKQYNKNWFLITD